MRQANASEYENRKVFRRHLQESLEHVVDAAPERTQGALCLGLNDCGEPDEVTGVPVGIIALHKPPATSDEMENKAFKGP
jgi:hypothetical protein